MRDTVPHVADLRYPVARGTLRAYLAVPTDHGFAEAGPWPAVVVIHEVFGLTDDIRRQADRFAAQGYLALAPDLFDWGATVRCLIATARAMAAGQGRALDDVQDARRFLESRDDCTGKVGVAGFCLGGGLAILVSPSGFAASAPNYGHLPRQPERRLDGACPIVASYGARDRPLKGAAAKLESVLSGLGVEHDVKEYAGARHGFLFPHSGKSALSEPLLVQYDPVAADDAWRRIFAFFDQHVKGTAP
ncbi:MAG: carboxymethylenebutenolidase [Frankiaceae bacterium]|nr:carboxymethylenebutenolidase [Frankiaceae bacterium]